MKHTVLLLAVLVFLTGCEESNRTKLNRLDVGMTKIQVLDIMGDPYRREAQNESEWLLYQTEDRDSGFQGLNERNNVPYPESYWLTPLYIENGKLVGWGSSYWENKEQKFDIKIEQN